MLFFLSRSIGIWLLAAAVVASVVDGMKSIASTHLLLTGTGQFWALVSPATLASAQAAVRKSAPFVWDYLITSLLQAPIALVFLVLGILFMVLGIRRRRAYVYAA